MKLTDTKPIDALLFVYGTTVAFIFTATAIKNLIRPIDILPLILFLPIPIYFFLKIVRYLYYYLHRFLNLDFFSSPPVTSSYFSLRLFLEQEDRPFLLTLILLSLAFSLILLRLSLSILSQP